MLLDTLNRRDEMPQLINQMGIKVGVELGVAEGRFSNWILSKSKIRLLYSIDRWAGDRGHGIEQYFRTVMLLRLFKERSIILRAEFSKAVKLFEDESFDFIYIDGYAHNAQESGRTLNEWFPKLKYGGLFSGHDYARNIKNYAKTADVVDEFVKKHKLTLHVTKDLLPSWAIIKEKK